MKFWEVLSKLSKLFSEINSEFFFSFIFQLRSIANTRTRIAKSTKSIQKSFFPTTVRPASKRFSAELLSEILLYKSGHPNSSPEIVIVLVDYINSHSIIVLNIKISYQKRCCVYNTIWQAKYWTEVLFWTCPNEVFVRLKIKEKSFMGVHSNKIDFDWRFISLNSIWHWFVCEVRLQKSNFFARWRYFRLSLYIATSRRRNDVFFFKHLFRHIYMRK